MRRKHGVGLTPHEMRVLAAALRLEVEGGGAVKGADLWTWFQAHEEQAPSAATVYRALRRLTVDHRLFDAHEEPDRTRGGKPRVYYTLTTVGRSVAQQAQAALHSRTQGHNLTWLQPQIAD